MTTLLREGRKHRAPIAFRGDGRARLVGRAPEGAVDRALFAVLWNPKPRKQYNIACIATAGRAASRPPGNSLGHGSVGITLH